jgi:hypothetical protein
MKVKYCLPNHLAWKEETLDLNLGSTGPDSTASIPGLSVYTAIIWYFAISLITAVCKLCSDFVAILVSVCQRLQAILGWPHCF